MSTKQDPCDICKFFKKKTPSLVVCKTCLETYCEQCAMYHKAFKISKDHVLLKSKKGPGNLSKKLADKLFAEFEEFGISPKTVQAIPVKKVAAKSPPSSPIDTKPKQISQKFELSLEGEFVIRAPTDIKSGFVHCITCLPDDRVVFVDWNNQRLKVCDRFGQLITSEQIDFNSWGVTCAGVDEVAVTNASQIDFYSIGNQSINKLPKCFQISCHGRGIHSYDNKRFVIADENGIILVIDHEGNQIRMFKLFEAFGKKIQRCYDVIFDQGGDNVVVADRTMNNFRVVCLSVVSGKALWEIPMETKPYGMVFIGASNTLLVSSLPKNVIYKVNIDTKSTEVGLNEDHGIYQPEGMIVQYGLGRLLVVDTDCVKIFSLY